MTDHACAIREALQRGGHVPDAAFDALLPDEIRRASVTNWTPVAVAVRAAAMLAPERGLRVLDVGSGPGKLCCIGALVTDARWSGVERHSLLVRSANALAIDLELGASARFTCGDMTDLAWRDFDSLYFYNPFEEALFASEPAEAPHRWTLFGNEVERAASALSALPTGTRVVTYHGYGGEMPGGFVLDRMEHVGTGQLALWTKATSWRGSQRVRAGWAW